ncbi:DNA-3-methyladenine glycosylase family protein [Halodesulfurarchaeum sp.]|uniref:DNA-3-methyladenine glycosylase family protein n=1 Tax=Halodesulfurarchaeum sp. TaxID=1980530 RepID=UPI002FC35763
MPVETRENPTDAHRHLRTDNQLAGLINQHGYLVLQPAEDPFRRLVKAIARQQVSMASAAATWERLTDAFAVTPNKIRDAEPTELQGVGLSAAKAEYTKTAAEAFDERNWSRDSFADLSDEAVIEELTEIRGIGPWTAKMFLQFGLGRSDVFPVEDLGIRQAVTELYGVESRAAMREQAEVWAPYRSIGSLYLWRAGDEK